MTTSPHLKVLTGPILIISILAALSSSSLLTLWLMLELNSMMFIFLASSSSPSQTSLKYFIIQSISSAVILLSSFAALQANVSPWNSLLVVMISLKLGLPPLHLWVFNIISFLSFSSIFILSTLQKIIPIVLLYTTCPHLKSLFWVALSCMTITLLFPPTTQIKPMLALSSIFTNAWLISTTPSWLPSLLYLLLYSLGLSMIMMYINAHQMFKLQSLSYTYLSLLSVLTLALLFLNLGGMPPLLGFLAKLISSLSLLASADWVTPIILLLTSIFIMLMYLQPIFLSLTKSYFAPTTPQNPAPNPSPALGITALLLFLPYILSI